MCIYSHSAYYSPSISSSYLIKPRMHWTSERLRLNHMPTNCKVNPNSLWNSISLTRRCQAQSWSQLFDRSQSLNPLDWKHVGRCNLQLPVMIAIPKPHQEHLLTGTGSMMWHAWQTPVTEARYTLYVWWSSSGTPPHIIHPDTMNIYL